MPIKTPPCSLLSHLNMSCRFDACHSGNCEPVIGHRVGDNLSADDYTWRMEALAVLHRIAGALEAIAATRPIVLHADATSAAPDQPEGDTIA